MKCNEIQEKLSAYIEGAIPSEEKIFINEHIKSCQRCSEVLSDLKKTVEYVRNLEEIEPPPWLTQKVMTRIRSEAEPKKGVLQKLLYPLHIKVPIGAVATIAIAVTTFYIFKTIQPPSPIIVSPDKIGTKQSQKPEAKITIPKDKIASLSARKKELPAEQPMPAKESETIDKIVEAPKAPGPVVEQKEVMPLAGAVAKEEMKRESLPAVPRAKALVERKKESIDLILNVKDIETANKEIERTVMQFEGKIIKTESLMGKNVIIAEFNSKKVKELIEKLKLIGEVKEKVIALETTEGDIEIRIEIVKISLER
jgi:hypothetical protein